MSDGRCSICRGECLTFNDPRPIPDLGMVCGECNRRVVLPVRSVVWTAAHEHRAAMVRLIVAQQWAMCMHAVRTRSCCTAHLKHGPDIQSGELTEALLKMPCAEDVVAEALGER